MGYGKPFRAKRGKPMRRGKARRSGFRSGRGGYRR